MPGGPTPWAPSLGTPDRPPCGATSEGFALISPRWFGGKNRDFAATIDDPWGPLGHVAGAPIHGHLSDGHVGRWTEEVVVRLLEFTGLYSRCLALMEPLVSFVDPPNQLFGPPATPSWGHHWGAHWGGCSLRFWTPPPRAVWAWGSEGWQVNSFGFWGHTTVSAPCGGPQRTCSSCHSTAHPCPPRTVLQTPH